MRLLTPPLFSVPNLPTPAVHETGTFTLKMGLLFLAHLSRNPLTSTPKGVPQRSIKVVVKIMLSRP